MKELLYETDNLLMRLEDYTHGKDGEDITKLRFKIAEALRQFAVIKSVCERCLKEKELKVCNECYCSSMFE